MKNTSIQYKYYLDFSATTRLPIYPISDKLTIKKYRKTLAIHRIEATGTLIFLGTEFDKLINLWDSRGNTQKIGLYIDEIQNGIASKNYSAYLVMYSYFNYTQKRAEIEVLFTDKYYTVFDTPENFETKYDITKIVSTSTIHSINDYDNCYDFKTVISVLGAKCGMLFDANSFEALEETGLLTYSYLLSCNAFRPQDKTIINSGNIDQLFSIQRYLGSATQLQITFNIPHLLETGDYLTLQNAGVNIGGGVASEYYSGTYAVGVLDASNLVINVNNTTYLDWTGLWQWSATKPIVVDKIELSLNDILTTYFQEILHFYWFLDDGGYFRIKKESDIMSGNFDFVINTIDLENYKNVNWIKEYNFAIKAERFSKIMYQGSQCYPFGYNFDFFGDAAITYPNLIKNEKTVTCPFQFDFNWFEFGSPTNFDGIMLVRTDVDNNVVYDAVTVNTSVQNGFLSFWHAFDMLSIAAHEDSVARYNDNEQTTLNIKNIAYMYDVIVPFEKFEEVSLFDVVSAHNLIWNIESITRTMAVDSNGYLLLGDKVELSKNNFLIPN